MIYTINNCIRAFGYTNFDKLIADMGSVDGLREYVRANGYADIAVAEDTELLLVDVNGKTWHTGCYGAVLNEYLCFTSNSNSTVAIEQKGTPSTSAGKVIQYKLNNGQWQNWDLSAVSLSSGDKMYVKSDDEISMAESTSIYKKFVMTGSIAASGNVMSLLNFNDTLTDYAFCKLFLGCQALNQVPELPATILAPYCYANMFDHCYIEQAPELPATTLAPYCYNNMFLGCFRLKTTPELPATTLAVNCYKDMFNGCTSLTAAPALPATTLAEGCYSGMFNGCTSLTTAALPATTLAKNCYNNMFNGCTSLTAVPALPATTLAEGCYQQMFFNCSSLVTASSLPATTLAKNCYNNMFWSCTALTAAPALPATTLVESCYKSMFERCSSLTTAPALPATTLELYCYYGMFKECTSLVQAPELPATELVSHCYDYMFYGCTKLNYVKAIFLNASKDYYQQFWLQEVSPTGTFIKNSAATWTNEQAGIPTGWTVQVEGGVTPEPEPERDYLCFTISCPDSSTFRYSMNTSLTTTKNLYYKINDGEWLSLYEGNNININNNDKLYLKSDDDVPMCDANGSRYITFGNEITRVDISGNIMSLMNFSDTLPEYCFAGLFSSNRVIADASKLILPNIVSNHCYEQMFYNCTSLTATPELPATTLAVSCYESMFRSCTSLTQVPNLQATTLTQSCYGKMFSGCTSLINAPELPATTLASSCYYEMFYGCTSLTQAPALPTTTLVDRCYYAMFQGCTGLTTAPELPATALQEYCYCKMFYNCTNLNYVKAMFTDIPKQDYLLWWLDNVSSTGTFVKNSAATWTNEQASIPAGWTVQTANPDK